MYAGLIKLAEKAVNKKKKTIWPTLAGIGAGIVGGVGALNVYNALKNKWSIDIGKSFLNDKWTPDFLDRLERRTLLGHKIFGGTPSATLRRYSGVLLGTGAAVGIPTYFGVKAWINRRDKNKSKLK